MTTEDMRQELERGPFVPLRLHLSSGKTIDVGYPSTAWLRQNTLLIVHPLEAGTVRIGSYDVVALRLIERIEQIDTSHRQAG
jgi:hypothetical protein